MEGRIMNETLVMTKKYPPSIYFGGCAFGGAFYNGVYNAMIKEWGVECLDHMLIGGDSVGSIFAIGLGLKYSPDEMMDIYQRVAKYGIEFGPHKACVMLEHVIKEMLSDPNAYKILEGKVFIGTTEFFSRHRWHLTWHSNEDLIECIKGSFNIPYYCSRNNPVKNIHVIDGAYSFAGTDLPHGNDSLFIGIDPHAEITRTFTNTEMFFPPHDTLFQNMVLSGEQSFREWLTHKTMVLKVGNRHPNYQALYVLWLLKSVDIFSVRIYSILQYVLIMVILYMNRHLLYSLWYS